MRTLAIGDIHGCLRAFDTLLELVDPQPDDLVVCDNLSSHKVCGVAEAIAARGAHLQYLPAYSPDLNPIEMAFSKLKALLRTAAARDLTSLVTATAEALDSFSSAECLNFFRHAQYATD